MELQKTLKEINKDRQKVECCFTFSCWADPDLFEDYKEVNVGKDTTLKTDDAIFYWQLGMSMHLQGIQKIDAISIDAFLANKDDIRTRYEQFGGYRTVEELTGMIDSENADGYYDQINRMNALSIFANKTEELFSDVNRFNNSTDDEIYDMFDLLGNSVAVNSIKGVEVENLTIDDAFIKSCTDREEMGLPYKSCPLLNYTTLGLPLGDVYMLAAHSGVGKALAVTEPVLTPTGFKPMGEIKLGDFVIGEDGKKTQVIGVYPQGKRQAYKITFEDGTEVICDKDHLWKSKYFRDEKEGKDWRARTTEEMYNLGTINSQGLRKFRVPRANPILDFTPKGNLLIPPYALGALIGDGCICRRELQFTTTEQDIVNRINKDLEKWGSFNQKKRSGIQFIYHTKLPYGNNMLRKTLETLNLYGLKSHEKFIPEEYLYASYEDRLALAQGLIDTDGHVDKKGHISFTTTSLKLKNDFMFLVRSLGKQVREKKADVRKQNPLYEVYICGLNPELFSSKKHEERYNNKIQKNKTYYHHHIRIENIEALEDEVEMKCIRVDNDSHTYLCRNFIVTHNSSFVFENMVLYLAGIGEPVVVFSNEMDSNAYKHLLLIHILTKDLNYWKLTRKKLKQGEFTEEDLGMIDQAKQISEDKYSNIKFVKLFNNNTSILMRFIKKYARQGCRCFIWDTFKSDDISDGNKEEWLQLLKNSRRVFNLISKLHVSLVMTFQLALYTTNQRYLDASCLAGSKQVKEVLSELIMMRYLWSDERSGEKNDCKAYHWDIEKKEKEMIQLDPDKKYLVVFVNKTRNDDAQHQILYQWDSHYNKFKEIGFCDIRNDHRGMG